MAITSIDAKEHTELRAFNSDGRIEYLGWGPPGATWDKSVWKIAKLLYISTAMGTQASATVWASGNTNPDKIWNNRTTYTYG